MISKTYRNKQPYEIISDVFLLGGGNFFNLYLIRGKEKTALVELGCSLIINEVINQIQKVGVEPDFLILTHPHSDHITGWNTLHQTYPQALLITGNNVYRTVNSVRSTNIISYEDKYLHNQFMAHNYSFTGKPIDKLIDFKNPIVVSSNTKIDLGGLSINCIPVKGHSLGNIIVEIPERRALFVSDSLGYQVHNRHIPMFLTSFNDYLNTIEKIANLNSDLIGPAHYGPFQADEAKNIVQFAKEETVTFCRKIDNKIKNNSISIEAVFNYMDVGLLNKISKKSMKYCAKLLIDNVKNRF